MKLFKRNAPCLAGMVLWIAVAGVSHAGPNRPFKGSLEVEQRVGRLTRCPGIEGSPGSGGTLTGSGHATHLGALQASGSHCIETDGGIPPASFRLFDGHMALRAANGDVLMLDYSGVFTRGAGIYTFAGEYVVSGGTGRFEDASGTGALSGSLQGDTLMFEQPVSLDANGRIAY